jgi:selenocysteine lyase/cysteine desulfurase
MGKNTKDDLCYLDSACMGLISKGVLNEIRAFISGLENISWPATKLTAEMRNNYGKARNAVAKLFKACPDEIAIVESTSHALGLIANCIPIEKINNILICDLEFLASALCWRARQELVGFEIRKVKTKNGEIRVCDFEKVIDKNTRAIIISSVQETNGFRTNIKELGQLAKKYNCYLIVDGIQEAGVLDRDLSCLDIDVYCAGGHKWLRNPFGAGFLYINKKIINELKPGFYSYFNLAEPDDGWQDYLESPKRTPFDYLKVIETAQKFETGGTGNYVGAFALYKNVMIILDYGIKNIEKTVRELNNQLIIGLDNLNLRITSSKNPLNMSGITSFSLPGGLKQERMLSKELAKHNVFVSIRYTSEVGGIRISPHYYNSKNDIERLLELTALFLRRDK